MAKITIREVDNTLPGLVDFDNVVVFIPGNTSNSEFKDFDTPLLFTSLDDFEKKIGKTPVEYTNVDTYKTNYAPYLNSTKDKLYDAGYMMARLVLSKGMQVLYQVPSKTSGNNKVVITTFGDMLTALGTDTFYAPLTDKGLYNPTFLTVGGYFSVDTAEKQTTLPNAITQIKTIAEKRGDCLALFDHAWDVDVNNILTIAGRVTTKYGAMFSPWCAYNINNIDITLPASVAYLEAVASGIVNNPIWYAMAGLQRGLVSGTPIVTYGEEFANTLTNNTGASVNPIAYVNGVVTIWGNRTLYNNTGSLVASSFLNIRNLCSRLKKQLYVSAKSILFEQNTDRLWFNFRSQLVAILDNMKTGQGISGYKVIKLQATERGQVRALIRIVPIEAVEEVDLTIELSDTLTVEEE